MPEFEIESQLKTDPLPHQPLPFVKSTTIKIEASGEVEYIEEPTDIDSSKSELIWSKLLHIYIMVRESISIVVLIINLP